MTRASGSHLLQISMAKLLRMVLSILAFATMALAANFASAAELHWDVVSKNPVSSTPVLVGSTAVPKPHVDALAVAGSTIFAGGKFDTVSIPGGSPEPRGNFLAFDAISGALRASGSSGYSEPQFDGQIWAIAAYGDAIYVGGEFTAVNGVTRPRLVKINAVTGAVDTTFNARIRGGIVWDLKIWNGPGGSSPQLVAAGSIAGRLIALDLQTGVNNGYFNLGIADPLPNAWGGVAVNNIAINPAGNLLIATGNFQTVQGQSRIRFFAADLSGPQAVLSTWYYPGFAKPCASTHPRRIAYLQDVDFSPDGTYFVVTATGQIPRSKADIWPTGSATYHTVCDATGRFNLSDSQHPARINYTGGDSVWSAAATGAAVYVQGHFEWLDNPNGFASQDGGGAVQRLGIGAIDPQTGKALPWNPAKPAQIGGKAFLATTAGLWVGSDSLRFDGAPHRGLAFAPIPAVLTGASDIADCTSNTHSMTGALLTSVPGLVFTLGDNAYQTGSASEYGNCYQTGWGAEKGRTRPAPGDRDYLTTAATGYFNYFGALAGDPEKGYYSYNFGHWHVVVLNSMCERVGGCTPNSPMITWLKADLAANPAKCTLAYFHHPLFTSGLNGPNSKMRPAWNALYAAKADVIINGHDNDYERFARQMPDGTLNETRGIRQFVVGTGGARLSGFGAIMPNSEIRDASTFGVLKLKLHPSSYDWQFLPAAGGGFTDSGSTNCY
jgi:hypothetical protein